jgi:DNA-binding MarR family transcriptional regulator
MNTDHTVAVPAAEERRAEGFARLWDTPVGSDLAFLLARANALSLSRMQAELAELDLKVRAYSVLSLVAADTRPSQRELAIFLQLDPSQVVALIDALESRGLLRREPDPRDRRANVLVITAAGAELADTARNIVSRSEEAWFASLSPQTREKLSRALRILSEADPDGGFRRGV